MENKHRFVLCDQTKLTELVKELQLIGCCNLCVIRYLGVTDPHVYRDQEAIRKILALCSDVTDATPISGIDSTEGEFPLKRVKRNACVACVGLLQDGIQDLWLDMIALEITSNGIEAVSYCPALSLPISLQLRAYSIWFHLMKKFGDFLSPINDLRPDGVSMKAAWKWICASSLRHKVDPKSEWGNDGNVKVEIVPVYEDELQECTPMRDFILQTKKTRKIVAGVVTRGSVESNLRWMESDVFFLHFESPPSIPTKSLQVGTINCLHEPIFIAGRYCKYSRELSQTPWLIDNVRKTEDSVEELISRHILSACGSKECKFSSSGREDVDVRMLGRGRPFVFEVIQPKRTIFSSERLLAIQKQINSNTSLISVRDIQLIDKKELGVLKTGEETKTKVYSALCVLPGRLITEEHLKVLNDYPLPIILKQKTPVRVLHRRSLATRERRILEMRATPLSNQPEMFKLSVRTDAGTYVKEFVHGDFGRTLPNIGSILGVEADILALDVMDVALDWPPLVQD